MSHFSTSVVNAPHVGPFGQLFQEIAVFLDHAVGPAATAVRLAELQALATANPTIAASLLAEELRRWRLWTGAINPARSD